MTPRPPTAPAEPTPEHNAILIQGLQRALENAVRDVEDLEEVVQLLRDRMIAVAGENGDGGKLAELLDKHDKSARSQGERLEKHHGDLAVLMGDRRIFQVLGAIAMIALGFLLKSLVDRATPQPEPRPAPASSLLLPQARQWSFAFTELTPEPHRGDDAA